ncbi:CitMHS family transporter [Corynebacterium neomassiliense]|uniref:CitMHS family transporter n=1 Tax=Corynebacterium neomassiliense TaxID=2079482 RepID=UPI001031949C|nr:SLC13 family permease [Corynebacterium neomassiliense]
MLALFGFLTVGVFLALTLFTRTSVLVGLVLVPVVFAVLAGEGPDLGSYMADGVLKVAPVAVMMTFAVLYFSLMMEQGLFDPLIRTIVRWAKGDPVKITVGTALVTMCVSLDGDGAATFLITLSAFLPIYRRIGMRPLVLTAVVALGAGLMNLLPWGGPTLRAMAALDLPSSEIFTPMIIPMIAGGVWVLVASYLLGRGERRRLGRITLDAREKVTVGAATGDTGSSDATGTDATSSDATGTTGTVTTTGTVSGDHPDFDHAAAHQWNDTDVPRWRMITNALLTVVLIVVMLTHSIPMEICFLVAFVIALCINIPSWKDQQELMQKHGSSVVLVTSMVFAAGVFTGVLGGTGMIQEMARALADLIPQGMADALPVTLSVISMPLSLVFTPDAFYFGVLPVFAETAGAMGVDPAMIAHAAIAGQMTTGFPLSPLTASTFILIGMAKVELGDHQKFTFLWAWGTTVVITLTALVTGALSI